VIDRSSEAPGATTAASATSTPHKTRGRIVVKIGSSSVTDSEGAIETDAIRRLCAEVVALREEGWHAIVVSSGAIATGWQAIGGGPRPSDMATLQAVAAVGQHRLMRVYDDVLGELGAVAGQVLLAPLDFVHRQQYLHARQTLTRLLDLGVIPVVNENDATSDDEIRFGDNDRLAALVAHLVDADTLVLLTDTPGLLSADPSVDQGGSLIEEVVEIDHELEKVAGRSKGVVGSGGMASKLAAAKMATWSGVGVVIADASRPGVVQAAVNRRPGVGTVFRPMERRLPARKLWIAFAIGSSGVVTVDEGARRALVEREASLLPAGVVSVTGRFGADDAVEIAGPDGRVFAKGLVRHDSVRVASWAGRRSSELPDGVSPELVHRDDLVVIG
jgi:glutamate 5-kinase